MFKKGFKFGFGIVMGQYLGSICVICLTKHLEKVNKNLAEQLEKQKTEAREEQAEYSA